MSLLRRGTTVLVLTVAIVLGTISPASAHAGGLSPTAARGEVVSVSPAVPGLVVTTIEDGARLLVHNDTGSTVNVPAGAGQAAAVSVPDGRSFSWIDARATTLERDLDQTRTVRWTVPMTVGATAVTVTGRFVAGPPPAALAWWVVAAGVATALTVVARRARRPDLILAVAGLVTVVASLAHVIGATLAVQSAPLWGTFIDATGIGLLVWPMVAAAAIAALRGSTRGVLGVCAGAGLSVVFILPDVTVFHYAVLPVAGPATLERLLVAVVLGAGTATAVAGAGALRSLANPGPERTSTLPDTAGPDTAGPDPVRPDRTRPDRARREPVPPESENR
ncbi:hypothetical protein [Promicromonospora sp. NPDC019610]|uniref:hypothetical protein n=1 Tax=Promicromonospora sp. NPDC019610 TaxID=3364405 RepID=UPI0037AAC859